MNIQRIGQGRAWTSHEHRLLHDPAANRFGDPVVLTRVAVAAHCALWFLVPSLMIGSLHTDTVEMATWGREFLLGYSKHPPLPAWLSGAAVSLADWTGVSPLMALVALGQICVAVAARYVWATVRLFGSPSAAALGVLVLLASPASTVYAAQLNHNVVLTPFWAATIYYALLYLERGRAADALALGLAAGLGFLSKYEIAPLFVALFSVALADPVYRLRLIQRPALLAGATAAAVIAPHILWLQQHDWPTLQRAVGDHRYRSGGDVLASAGNFLSGQALLFAIPLATRALRWRRTSGPSLEAIHPGAFDPAPSRPTIRLGWIVLGPVALMLVGAVLTQQMIKPLWALPFMPGVAAWIGLRADRPHRGVVRPVWPTIRALAALSLSALIACAAALAVSIWGRWPNEFVADSGLLAHQAGQFWRSHDDRRLSYLLVDSSGLAPAASLWMADAPRVVQDATAPQTPRGPGEKRLEDDLLRTGGLALLRQPFSLSTPIRGLCVQSAEVVAARYVLSGAITPWRITVAYLPARSIAAQRCPSP